MIFAYLETSTLILCWCAFLSLLWAVFCYATLKENKPVKKSATPFLPGLLLAPVLVVLFFQGFGLNLIFPVHELTSTGTLVVYGIAPSLVLCFASGLFFCIRSNIQQEFLYWNNKPCALFTKSVGGNTKRQLAKLVVSKSLSSAWLTCLPWLFGELIIVEAIFNAPGLGLDAWNLAKIRDGSSLLEVFFWMALLYLFFFVACRRIHSWIGVKLESY